MGKWKRERDGKRRHIVRSQKYLWYQREREGGKSERTTGKASNKSDQKLPNLLGLREKAREGEVHCREAADSKRGRLKEIKVRQEQREQE